jgi:hypothetical protein
MISYLDFDENEYSDTLPLSNWGVLILLIVVLIIMPLLLLSLFIGSIYKLQQYLRGNQKNDKNKITNHTRTDEARSL